MERQPIPVEEFSARYRNLSADYQKRLSNFMEMLEQQGVPSGTSKRPTAEAWGALKGKIKILPGFDNPILED